MVETKGTPAANNNGKGQPPVNSTAELREWCARQRKFLVAERDAAKTPDAKLIRVGMLRMLNNVEGLLVQASTSFTKQPLPSTFPRSFDELSAVLLDYYDLPRTFPVMDLLNGRWRFQVIRDHPYHKGPILTLNRYAHDKDLMNAILQILHDMFYASPILPANDSLPAADTQIVSPEFSTGAPIAGLEPPKGVDTGGKRGRKAGVIFACMYECPCGKIFKYRGRLEVHQASCPKARVIENKGRRAGQTFTDQFKCPCGRTFKYKKVYDKHRLECMMEDKI